jgi:Viral BACON domain
MRPFFLALLVVCLTPPLFGAISVPLPDPPTFSATISSPIVTLPFRVKDAEFSTALNAIIAVSESPNQLQIFYPETQTLQSVNLPVLPYNVSVSPDGLFAVVGHDAWVSYVDLSAPALLKSIAVPYVVQEIVFGPNNYAHAIVGYWGDVLSINLQTEATNTTFSWRAPESARMHPALNRFYGADRGTSPDDIVRVNITPGGAAGTGGYDSIYHGDYAMCGDLWISMDGLRLFTACGNVFRASDDPSFDMHFAGKLSEEIRIAWTAHSQPGNSIAVLPAGLPYYNYPTQPTTDDEIHYYTHDFLLYRGRAVLPSFVVEDHTWKPRGRWLFFNAAGTKQYVVIQAEEASGMLYDFGVVTVDCTNAPTAVTPASTTIDNAANSHQFPVTGSAGCGWKATSNAAWISTTSSGVGDGTLTFAVTANATAIMRVGTITVGGSTFTVTQNGLTPPSVAAIAGSPSSVSLTWPSSGSVDHYEVWRSSGAGFSLIASPATPGYSDGAVSANASYLYKVRAVVSGGGTTAFGATDYAHTFSFTDPALIAGMTIKAAHVSQLRSVVQSLRTVAGLGPATFTDPSLSGLTAKRVHITELRDALNAVRTAIALPTLVFPALSVGSPIAAQHTNDLRAGVQ